MDAVDESIRPEAADKTKRSHWLQQATHERDRIVHPPEVVAE